MEFNLAEKLAIVKAIDEVILSDGQIKESEIRIMNKLSYILDFHMDLIQDARKVDARECMSVLRALPKNKQHALWVLLAEAANADGSVTDEEQRLILGILEAAGIESPPGESFYT